MNRISVPKNRKNDVSSACIRDIFLHRKNSRKKFNSYLKGKILQKSEYKERKMGNMELIKGGLYEESNNSVSSYCPCR